MYNIIAHAPGVKRVIGRASSLKEAKAKSEEYIEHFPPSMRALLLWQPGEYSVHRLILRDDIIDKDDTILTLTPDYRD